MFHMQHECLNKESGKKRVPIPEENKEKTNVAQEAASECSE